MASDQSKNAFEISFSERATTATIRESSRRAGIGIREGSGQKKPRRKLQILLAIIVLFLILIGPWPANNCSYVGSAYQQHTLQNLASTPPPDLTPSPIRAGVAQIDITPPQGHPLAGFFGRKNFAYQQIDSRCFARALTLQSATSDVTILTADILLINQQLARAVLERTGLKPNQIYFTASHTHSGPGAWGSQYLEKLVTGKYDPQYFQSLADQLAHCVAESRRSLTPSEIAVVTVAAQSAQSNRVLPNSPTHDQLTALLVRPAHSPDDPFSGSSIDSFAPPAPTAILAVFGAHATVVSPDPPTLSADYPGRLADELQRQTSADAVLFAAGAVGDASPIRPPAPTSTQSAELLGVSLAQQLLPAIATAKYESSLTLSSLYLDVELPSLRIPIGAHLQLSPICSSWISDRSTHLHALRVGHALLVGFPGDYAGHLADHLAQQTTPTGLTLIATSFNGDYKGYFVSQSTFFSHGCYETRSLNFFGPYSGDYLNDLAQKMISQLASNPTPIPTTNIK